MWATTINFKRALRVPFHIERSLGTSQHCKSLHQKKPNNTQPPQSATYMVVTNFQYFEKVEVKKMLSQKIIKPAQTELVPSTVLAPKIDKLFQILRGLQKVEFRHYT